MRVSVVIPVKDDPRVLTCVRSVLACHEEADELEVIVVDNGSEPSPSEGLRALAPSVAVVEEPVPGSFRARNRGIEAATGDAVFFTDADAEVEPGWIREGLLALEAGIDVARGASTSQGTTFADRVVQERIEGRLRALREGDRSTVDTKNLAVRGTVLKKLRFDGELMRGGDTSFGLRAEQAGFRVAYWPKMRVRHEHESSLAVFVAKHAAHTWAMEKVRRQEAVPWPRGHIKFSSAVAGVAGRLPGAGPAAWAAARTTVALASLLDRRPVQRLRFRAVLVFTTGLGMAVSFLARVLYNAGQPAPLISQLLGEQRVRE